MISRKVCFIVSCSFLFLTGCWDQVDIEERGFIIGSAVDMMGKKENGEYELRLTNQFVIPSTLGAPTQGGGDSDAFTNISATGESMFAISREMAQLTSRSPYWEHLKIIIVSKEIAETKNLFAKIMDIFLRNPSMRRSIKVIVADEDAKNVLDVKPTNEKLPALYIESVMENSFKTASALEPVRVGQVHAYLLNQNSYVIPKITTSGEGIQYEGAAVFHGYDNKMVGMLDGEETKGLNLLTGNAKEGAINIELDDNILTYELEDVKSNLSIDTKDKNNIHISVKVKVEGSIAETFGTENIIKKKTLDEVEKQVKDELEKIINHTIKKAQTELNADIFGIGDMIKERHYDLWQQIKNEWDHGESYFAKSTFHVAVNAEVRATGSSDQTKKHWSER
ncbi:Ger(x)C family spore germination protein [Virgibacillus oceani]|uniref:Germination protein GerLC n=1 Tax=Virgibacillus oceani TaxID=1479511 RepID=A0A917M2Z4_9BACI|nr:Ger(x)C family spore germination protein [Virgibacillus oceani]GGG73973.1 germination protein GerLC [Virgibacillus oceani]